jgi:hypothetical protein
VRTAAVTPAPCSTAARVWLVSAPPARGCPLPSRKCYSTEVNPSTSTRSRLKPAALSLESSPTPLQHRAFSLEKIT